MDDMSKTGMRIQSRSRSTRTGLLVVDGNSVRACAATESESVPWINYVSIMPVKDQPGKGD